MRFTYFRIENFKGIESQRIDISTKSENKIFTLVGLNESGKTTVLEAINYFAYKPESLSPLNLSDYDVADIHNLIPINKRDNFNGNIVIEAGVEIEDEDVEEIKNAFKEKGIVLKDFDKEIIYTQIYPFENSVYQKEKTKLLWSHTFNGIIGKGRKIVPLKKDLAQSANIVIKKKLPSILYFPNFLFEFPEKIYLDGNHPDPKHKFYQKIIQDVLDSLENNTNINDHLIKRIQSDDEKDSRNLNSLIGKMQKQLTTVIFQKWNQIFNKEISKTEVILFTGKDGIGSFLEFNIKDDVDTYRIIERSLGFRWFFVYILLTQFRTYRKQDKNAFFLFDEPASNLHPSAQTELLKSFEKLSNVIYTTHSHYLINPKWLEKTFVIKNEAIDYENEIRYHSKNTNIKITKYREFASKHPNQSSYFQPILEVLDYRPTNLELVPEVVITEGKNDFYTYNYFQDVIIKKKNPLSIIPGTSATNMESLISLYLGWGKKFIVLLDSDSEGLKQKKKYEDLYGPVLLDWIFTYADIDTSWKNFEAESLFSNADKIAIQSQFYPNETKFDKKIFNRSIQELYNSSQKVAIQTDSISALEKVIGFIEEKFKQTK